MNWVEDRLEDVGDTVSGAVNFVLDEIVNPVVNTIGKVIEGITQNPVQAIAQIAAIATQQYWLLPVIAGAATAAAGGDLGDIAKAVAISYIAQEAGTQVGKYVGSAVTNEATAAMYATDAASQQTALLAAQEAGMQTAGQIAGNVAGSVAASTTVAVVKGQDPVKAMLVGGINAGVPAVLGQIDGFQNLSPTTQKVIESAVKTQLAGGNVSEAVVRSAITASQLATDTIRNLDPENKLSKSQQAVLADVLTAASARAVTGGNVNAAVQNELMRVGSKAIGDITTDKFKELTTNIETKSNDFATALQKVQENETAQSSVVKDYNVIRDQLQIRLDEQNKIKATMDAAVTRANQYTQAYNNGEVSLEEAQMHVKDANDEVARYNDYVNALNNDYTNTFKPQLDALNGQLDGLKQQHGDLYSSFDTVKTELQDLSKQLGTQTQALENSVKESYVKVLAPNFNAEQYRAINNIPEGVDVYDHYLSTGRFEDLATSNADLELTKQTQSKIASQSSFSDAFKMAREELGPGKTFEWKGNKYSTATREEDPTLAAASDAIKAKAALANTPYSSVQEMVDTIKSTPSQTEYGGPKIFGVPIGTPQDAINSAIRMGQVVTDFSRSLGSGFGNFLDFMGFAAHVTSGLIQSGPKVFDPQNAAISKNNMMSTFGSDMRSYFNNQITEKSNQEWNNIVNDVNKAPEYLKPFVAITSSLQNFGGFLSRVGQEVGEEVAPVMTGLAIGSKVLQLAASGTAKTIGITSTLGDMAESLQSSFQNTAQIVDKNPNMTQDEKDLASLKAGGLSMLATAVLGLGANEYLAKSILGDLIATPAQKVLGPLAVEYITEYPESAFQTLGERYAANGKITEQDIKDANTDGAISALIGAKTAGTITGTVQVVGIVNNSFVNAADGTKQGLAIVKNDKGEIAIVPAEGLSVGQVLNINTKAQLQTPDEFITQFNFTPEEATRLSTSVKNLIDTKPERDARAVEQKNSFDPKSIDLNAAIYSNLDIQSKLGIALQPRYTNDQIVQKFNEIINGGGSTANFAAAMDQYLVSPEKIAAAFGTSVQDVQNEYNRVFPTGIYSTVKSDPKLQSYKDLVSKAYNDILLRNPERNGMDYWVGQLSSGALTPDNIYQNIASSAQSADQANAKAYQDRLNQAVKTGATTDATVQQATDQQTQGYKDLVTKAYNDILLRNPEQQGMDYWVDQLKTGKLSPDNLYQTITGAAQGVDQANAQTYQDRLNAATTTGATTGTTTETSTGTTTGPTRSEQIAAYIKNVQDTGGTTADIAAAMDQYGVTPAEVGAAINMSPDMVQAYYNDARPNGIYSTSTSVNTNTGTVTNTNTGSVVDTNTGTVTDTNTGVTTNVNTGVTTDANTGTTTNANTVTDTNTGTVTNTNTGTVTDTNTGTVTDTNTGVVTNANTGTVTDTSSGSTTSTSGGSTTTDTGPSYTPPPPPPPQPPPKPPSLPADPATLAMAMKFLTGEQPTATDDKLTFKDPFISSKVGQKPFESPLAQFISEVESGSYRFPEFADQSPKSTINLGQSGETAMPDYFTYGSQPDLEQFFNPFGTQSTKLADNELDLMSAAQGGLATPLMAGGGTARYGRYAGGGLPVVAHSGKARLDFRSGAAVTGAGDGQSDDIPAMLADGEFVIPADVVAALGNGSTKAGSEKLYDMMHSVRSYHRSAKPQDLPPAAKSSPLDYLKKSSKKARR